MNVFITGGTSGIGLALAKVYQSRGDTVAICGRNLEKVPEEWKAKFHLYQVDVKDRKQVNDAVNDFIAKEGLDLLIANAGRSVGPKSIMPDFDVALELIDINIKGVMHSFEAALKYMLPRKKGHIVAVGSVAGMVGLPGASSYSASKAWVNTLCESFSLDLPPQGVDVTCIAPGFIDTPLTQQNDHSMPFIMEVDKAAQKIVRAIDKKKVFYIFPLPMKILIYFLDRMPRWLYRFIMSIKIFNYSRDL